MPHDIIRKMFKFNGMKPACEEIRNLAVALRKSGRTIKEVAEIVGYHPKSIQNWMKADANGLPQKARGKGRPPRILSQEDLVELKAMVDSGKYHSLDELTTAFGKCSRSVVYRSILSLGYTYKKKLFLPLKGIPPK